MIVSSDKEYVETKLIRQGKKKIKKDFVALVDWIQQNYEIKPINIYYEYDKLISKPRLMVILEYEKEEKRFLKDTLFPKPEIAQNILSQFKILYGSTENYERKFPWINNYQIKDFSLDKLFVIFKNFENIAKKEATSKIPQEKIEKLEKKLKIKDLWKIFKFWYIPTFFFYTDKQIEEYSKKGVEKYLTDCYFDLLKKYDEFDYIKREDFKIKLDSKENFDKNYQSNWFYYTR
nr:hypothetical protein [uncultured Draconibacterium sp.]